MLAIKKARKLIEANPNSEASKTLAALVVALETEASFPLNSIYTLGDKPFQLALDILAEWRLDRHYAKKMRLMDVINQAQEKPASPESADAPAPTDTPATAA
ncbi:MAG: hypothetical protein ACOVO0_11800 [Burkholderiaceae bacterium]